MHCKDHQKDWDRHLPGVLFSIRTTKATATGETPFFLVYGRQPTMPQDADLFKSSKVCSTIKEYRDQLLESVKIARKAANDKMEETESKLQKKI